MDFIDFGNLIKLSSNLINDRNDVSLPELTIQKSIIDNTNPSFIVIIKGIDYALYDNDFATGCNLEYIN